MNEELSRAEQWERAPKGSGIWWCVDGQGYWRKARDLGACVQGIRQEEGAEHGQGVYVIEAAKGPTGVARFVVRCVKLVCLVQVSPGSVDLEGESRGATAYKVAKDAGAAKEYVRSRKVHGLLRGLQ